MSALELKGLSHPTGEVIKIAAGKTLDLKTQGSVTMPTGSVLQVVYSSQSTAVTSTTNAFSDTGLAATITPTSPSSKILVVVSVSGIGTSFDNTYCQLNLLRGSTNILSFIKLAGYTATTTMNYVGASASSMLDTPSTTSATTYKVQFANGAAAGSVYVQDSAATSTITLMEIQG